MPNSTTQTAWFAPSGRTVRQAVDTHSNGVDCPQCATALTSREEREIESNRFTDPVEEDNVQGDTVDVPGWWCENCNVVVPVSRPTDNLPFDPGTWKPVCIDFDGDSDARWVPVRRSEFRTAETDGERPVVCHVNENYDQYIGRGPAESTLANTPVGQKGWLGNPFQFSDHGGTWPRDDAVGMYVQAVFQRLDDDPEFARALGQLKGSRLACDCRYSDEEDPLCHGDALADIIERL